MITSTSQFFTQHGCEYLGQLCARLAKRVPVQAGGNKAHVTLVNGSCELTANDKGIAARVQSCPHNIDRMEAVFGGWIECIAFRENAYLTWHRATHPT